MKTISFSRQIPLRYSADIAVLGGGIAGVAAAVTAARAGVSVILVERFSVLGGNATSGGVANFSGETHGQGAFFDDILAKLEKKGAIVPYIPGKERVFNHHYLGVILQETALEAGVKLLYHTRVADVCTEGRKITSVVLSGTSGLEGLCAKVYIDCTGDACVARAAGLRYMKGNDKGAQLPMSEMYFVRHVSENAVLPTFDEMRRYETAADLPMTSVWPDGEGSNAIKIKVPRFDSTDTESLTAAEIEARRRAMAVFEYHRRSEKRLWNYDGNSPIIGIREGVRILGDYVLTLEDLRSGRAFTDAVARGTYPLDGHKPDDDGRTYILPENERRVPPYHIPLRCLIAADSDNLLMAGRCMSAEQLALSSARVMPTCAMMGTAAGKCGALAVQQDTDIRGVDGVCLRRILETEGANLSL